MSRGNSDFSTWHLFISTQIYILNYIYFTKDISSKIKENVIHMNLFAFVKCIFVYKASGHPGSFF